MSRMHQYKDSKTTLKIAKEDKLQRPVTAVKIQGQTEQKLGNRNRKKNNCKAISREKLEKPDTRKSRHDYGREALKEKLNLV